MKRFIFFLLLISHNNFAKINEIEVGLNAQDFALNLCLINNYKNYGVDVSAFNDISSLNKTYSPNDWGEIYNFVMEKTSNYYKDEVYIHLEEKEDKVMNIIFLKCMGFYHSKELNKFLKNKIHK